MTSSLQDETGGADGRAGVPVGDGAAVHFSGVVRRYREPESKRLVAAVAGVTLEIGVGEWVCILGPNGSGKSTLMRVLCGLERADEGVVEVFGLAVGTVASHRGVLARMGVVFQRPALDKLLTVRENLRLQAALHGVPVGVRESILVRAAERAEISQRLESRVDTLSGGLARRADLARAMLPEPALLVLDEPTVGLDHAARMALMETLGSLRDGSGRTIIMSTHLMDEAELCDRVVMLDEGRVVADGSPAELREACGGVVVRCFVTSEADVERVERVLEGAGLSHERHVRMVIGRGPAIAHPRFAQAVGELVAMGVGSVTAGPPTLADAYLAKTGKALEPDVASAVSNRGRWSTD